MKKICIIKLGADGDVIRTLPLARALKEKNPDSEITWITKGDIAELIEGNRYIDKIFVLPYNSDERFDELYNFDIDKEAVKIAVEIKADEKYGFYSEDDYPKAFNVGAEYYLNTFFDDEIKKKNKKTYQEMMFMAAELNYRKEYCAIELNEEERDFALDFSKGNYLHEDKLIGIHIGASSRWPSKAWSSEKIKEFIIKAKEKGYEVILFGGPNEASEHAALSQELERKLVRIYRNNPYNTKREFASLVSLCRVMICSDSFALHVSLALGKKTIGLFFVTSPDEVEDYGLLTKIISPKLYDFFPEKSNEYNEELVNSISSDEVLAAVDKAMKN